MIKLLDNFVRNENNIKRIFKGTIISILVTMLGLGMFSTLLTYTKISENTIPTVTIIITVISILIGSSLSMNKIKKNGLLNGAIVGLTYILFIYFLSSIIEGNFSLNVYSIIMIIRKCFGRCIRRNSRCK